MSEWIFSLFNDPNGRPSLPSVLLGLLSILIVSVWIATCWKVKGMADIPSGPLELLMISAGLKFGVRASTEATNAWRDKQPDSSPIVVQAPSTVVAPQVKTKPPPPNPFP